MPDINSRDGWCIIRDEVSDWLSKRPPVGCSLVIRAAGQIEDGSIRYNAMWIVPTDAIVRLNVYANRPILAFDPAVPHRHIGPDPRTSACTQAMLDDIQRGI